MQENKLISTIETLKSVGQNDAIATFAKNLKEAYDYAIQILGETEDIKQESSKDEFENPKPILKTVENKFYEYSSKWNLKQKLQYILKKENRFLHFREVAKIILLLEGKEISYENQRDLAKLLSGNTAIRNLKKKDVIVNILHEGAPKKSFWGSKKWVDKNNNILPGYEYSLDITNEGHKVGGIKESKNLFDI